MKQYELILQTLEHKQHTFGFSENRANIIDTVKSKMYTLLRTKAEFDIHRSRVTDYFSGTKTSPLLAINLNKCSKYKHIKTIKTMQDNLTDPQQINNEFCSYYKALYSSTVELNKVGCKNFLNDLALSSLSPEEIGHLNGTITLEEVHKALCSMKKGKSPGWDGISPEFYLIFWDELGVLFLKMILTSVEKGCFINDANQAIITVLPKPNKDPTLCCNYRP